MHFAVNLPIGMVGVDFLNGIIDFGEVGVFATTAFSGIGEHGDFGWKTSIGGEGFDGIFNDSIKLVLIGNFVDAAVGDGKNVASFFTYKTTREELRNQRDVVFVGEQNVTRGVVKASNHSVGLSGL